MKILDHWIDLNHLMSILSRIFVMYRIQNPESADYSSYFQLNRFDIWIFFSSFRIVIEECNIIFFRILKLVFRKSNNQKTHIILIN